MDFFESAHQRFSWHFTLWLFFHARVQVVIIPTLLSLKWRNFIGQNHGCFGLFGGVVWFRHNTRVAIFGSLQSFERRYLLGIGPLLRTLDPNVAHHGAGMR